MRRLFNLLLAAAVWYLCASDVNCLAQSEFGPANDARRTFNFSDDHHSTNSILSAHFESLLEALPEFPVSIGAEWITDSDTAISSYNTGLKLPILKVFGSPPPIVSLGFDFTSLESDRSLGLPEDLFEYSIGVSRVRRWTERWVFRSAIGVGFVTDNQNRSSDAWQFRGSAFGIYQRSQQWQWSFGAIALGRRDLPVIPAIGAVWNPNANTRVDLILPTPKVNFLLSDDGLRQRWYYLGAGFSGTTWGYESETLGDDVLTYRDWRLLTGWKTTPKAPEGVPFARGRKNSIEFGYVFARELEFNDERNSISLQDSFFFGLASQY